MKTVVLRESQAPYTLAIDNETMNQEPVILEQDGRPVAVLVPLAEYEAFRAWREMLDEPWPEEPPPTPEGDREALAAVERIGTMFADVDPDIWHDVMDDELLNLENLWILLEEDHE
jgi:prevent-host-death family protein